MSSNGSERHLSSTVKVVCPYRFAVYQQDDDGDNNNDNVLYLPYCGEEELLDGATTHNTVQRIVIILPGFRRDANNYFNAGVVAKEKAAPSQTTIVLALQFLLEKDVQAHELDATTILYWNSVQWSEGRKSVADSNNNNDDQLFQIDSFNVMNQLLQTLLDQELFPNLEAIVVFGHGAGSQFVQRYAAGSTVQVNDDDNDDENSNRPSIHYVLGNPGTFLYFSEKRAKPGTLDAFEVPPSIYETCPQYNDYKYGLNNMNAYMSNMGASTLKQNYVARQVDTLLGELDNHNAPPLDATCAGHWQGRHRREKGVIFHNHLLDEFGQETIGHHGFYFVPGSGHEKAKMMQSSCGRHLLFGAGLLEDSCSTTLSWSPMRFLTCEGCQRNILLVAALVSSVVAAAAWYYHKKYRPSVKRTEPLLNIEVTPMAAAKSSLA